MTTASLPRLAVTLGDPAGVGPELALRLGADEKSLAVARPLLFGDAELVRRVADRLSLPFPPKVATIKQLLDGDLQDDEDPRPTVIDFASRLADVEPGVVTAETGAASFEWFRVATRAAIEGRVAAVVTGPIHKEAWSRAGVPFPGHTESLAEQTGVDDYCMMLTSESITCALVTTHIGLADVPGALDAEKIRATIRHAGEAMRRVRGREPRLAVLGLNPHAGEAGLFGKGEEERIIAPAIEAARRDGWTITGPLPPDTAFLPNLRRATDAYICMYHDQGLIPLKTLAFDSAVNVTLGLPIVRTSVDHGTALDLAWRGEASPSSLFHAFAFAARLAGGRQSAAVAR